MKHKLQIISFFIIASGLCMTAYGMEKNQGKKNVTLPVDKKQQKLRVSPSNDDEKTDDADRPSFLTEGDLERIKREPEGCELCMCNAGCGAMMLGVILALTFCK